MTKIRIQVMYICIHDVHTHIGIRKTRNWFRYETFYYLFEFQVFRHEERERHTQFLSILPFPSESTTCGTPPQTTGLASVSFENRLPSSKPKFEQTVFFFKFQNSQPIASEHDVIHLPGLFFIRGFYCDIRDCQIRPVRA